MPKLYDEEGNEVPEVFTKEELDAKLEEAKKNSMTAEQLKEYEDLKKKDFNFGALRDKLKEKGIDPDAPDGGKPDEKPEEKPDEKKEKPPEKPADKPEEKPTAKPAKEVVELSESEGLDEDQKAKAQYFFNQLAGTITDPAVRRAFAKDAVRLAKAPIGSDGRDLQAGVHGRGGRGTGGKDGEEPVPADREQMGREVYGLTKEDHEKYGKKDWSPRYTHLDKRPKPKE